MNEKEYAIGATAVVKVHEMDLNDFTATQLLPNLSIEILAKHPEWVDARTYDGKRARCP